MLAGINTSKAQVQYVDIDQNFVDELNKCLNEFKINNYERICHFMAQCSVESRGGRWSFEGEDDPNTDPIDKYSKYDYHELNAPGGPGVGAKYRGAGLIHITFRDTYRSFYEYLKSKGIDDPKIINDGALYVAQNYPIIASGYYWTIYKAYKDLNAMCDNGKSVEEITEVVNGGYSQLNERKSAYKSSTLGNF